MNNPFSKINPGAIPGPIFFMHGLNLAESLQFYLCGMKNSV
jgi:hypothetical protein